jgi:dTDP-4-dehydrorhamnose 3,5-epimerase
LMGDSSVAQVNRTQTARRGTVRGMHLQLVPHAESKLVTCLRGAAFDVAVDLRHESPTFLRWHGEVLSGAGRLTMFIPEGFAHGYQTLADDCELLYLHSTAYQSSAEFGVNPRDPRLAIAWPIEIAEMSARDASHPMLTDDYPGVAP